VASVAPAGSQKIALAYSAGLEHNAAAIAMDAASKVQAKAYF
jgi:hypothetical protein